MQFQIPQFIETEDKIIGPFTLKQFLFIAAPALISFLFYLVLKTWIWFLLSVPLIALGVALAFLKINGRPFSTVFSNAFSYYWAPQTYVWQPKNPALPKNATTLRESISESLSLESILQGLALKNAWRYIQTGSKVKEEPAKEAAKPKERYQIFRSTSGERRAAKRVDYR